MESGSPGGRPDVWNDQRLWTYEPWYKIGGGLVAEAKQSFVAHNMRTPEVTTALEQGLQDVSLSKVSPPTGADQVNHAIQAIQDQPR